MNLTQLRKRILGGEDLHTEFKERFSSDRDLARELVSFANTDGGQLIFGVSDDLRVVGVEDPDWLISKVDDISFQHCSPPITVVQEVLNDDGRNVVVVNIPKGDSRPYSTKSGLYYVRTAKGCRPASREELLRLFQAVESLYYDETPLPRLTWTDLDIESVERYLRETGQPDPGVEVERLLRNWRLYDGRHPTIAGLVLFGRSPQDYLPFAQITAVHFMGSDPSQHTKSGGSNPRKGPSSPKRL